MESHFERQRMAARAAFPLIIVVATSLALGLVVLACDSATPVAPAGSTVSITANPNRIPASGESRITVVALKANGQPVNPGTVVRLSTTVGQIDGAVTTDNDGVGVAMLRGNGEFGTATVSATIGASTAVTVEVKVGLSAGSVTLQANPGSVSENGGSIDLLAIVRDDQGQLLVDAEVNFSSPIGILDSGGEPVATDASGVARDVLEVDESEIGTANDFTVEAEVASGEGALLKDDVKVSILRRPRANFNFQVNRFQVVFEDTSTGEPTSWEWEFDVTDQGSGPTSRLQNPVHTYGETGAKTVRLTVRNAQGDDEITRIVQITAQ